MANITKATIGVAGDPTPPEGLRVIGPFTYDFSVSKSYQVNLRAQMETASLISFARMVYIDNSANASPVSLFFAMQNITVKGNTQGWYPTISERPIQYTISSSAAAGVTMIFFSNYDTHPFQWATQ